MNAQINISNVTLTTERLVLRPWRETDLEDLYEYARVDGVGQMAGWLPHENPAESRAVLQMFMNGKKTFAVEYAGKVVGSLGIEIYREDHYPQLAQLRGREIGYALAKDCWGKGLMTEAVRAVINYLFEQIDLDFLVVSHFAHNDRSRRVIEKCGFRFLREGTFETQYETVEPTREYLLWNPKKK